MSYRVKDLIQDLQKISRLQPEAYVIVKIVGEPIVSISDGDLIDLDGDIDMRVRYDYRGAHIALAATVDQADDYTNRPDES